MYCSEKERIKKEVEKYFKRLRFLEKYHLGLGDIRLTIGMQEEILSIIEGKDD